MSNTDAMDDGALSDQERPPPQEQAGSEGKPRLSWTTKHGTTRADSDLGGYWITWANAGWCVWHNAFAMVDGRQRCICAGKKQDCLDACEAHYAKQTTSNNVPSPQHA